METLKRTYYPALTPEVTLHTTEAQTQQLRSNHNWSARKPLQNN